MRLTRSPSYKWVVSAMAFLGMFGAIGFGRWGYSAVLPSMQKALDLSGAAAGSLASWNLAGYTIMALVGGILASRFGSRAVITIGLIVTALGMFLTGLSGGLLSASAARLLTGMGNGMVLAPSVALMSAWFTTRQLGVASGIVSAGPSLALVIAGPVVPRIIAAGGTGGWRLAWYFFAAITVAMAVLTVIVQRDRPHEETPKAARKRAGLPDFKGIVRSRYAWHLGFVYLVYGVAAMFFFTFFQKRLTADLGYSSETAGNLFLLVGIGGLCSMLWGGVSDRIGRGRALAVTMVIEAAAAGVFSLWHNTAALAISAALFGFSALSMAGLIGAACGDRFGARLASASLGFVTIFIGIGQAVGPYVGGLIGDAFSSLGPSYLLAAGVFLVGAVAALLLRDGRPGVRGVSASPGLPG